jgi:hypothetical protein
VARKLSRVVREEDVDARLRELADALAKRGKDAGQVARARQDLFRTIPTPDLTERFIEEARKALEDEVDFARPAEFEGDIEPAEIDREIAKKALARLRLEQLRNIAAQVNVESRGREEEVIERIAHAYDFDEAQIARLVLQNEEPTPERGVSDRLFPLLEPRIDLGVAEQRLDVYRRRYIRTGIARWFVFGDIVRRGDSLLLNGTFRSYRVDPVGEEEEFDLVPIPATLDVRVRLVPDGRFIEVRGRGVTESRAAAQAVMKVLNLRPLSGVPIEATPQVGDLMIWDSRSVFLIGFLQNQLDRDGLTVFNLTSAQFETGEAIAGSELRPNVRSVRFEGSHLLSSKPACELLVEGRALVGISLLVRFAPKEDESYLLPLRFSLERDHAAVLTGFGAERPEVADQLQRLVVKRLIRAFERPVGNEKELAELATRIRARARQDEPVERADILAPEEWAEPEASQNES